MRYKGAAQRRKAVKGTPMATAVPLQAAKSVSSGRRVRDLRAALSELLAAARLDADAGGEGLAQLHRRIEVSS